MYLCSVWYGWHGGDHMGTIIATLRVDQQNGLPALIEFHGSQQNGILFVKYGLQVTFYLPKYCKKVPIYCIKIQVKSWFVAINTSTEK